MTNPWGVMIGYLGSKKIKVNIIKTVNQARILIMDVDIDEDAFVLISLTDTEMEQIKTISKLDQLLSDISIYFLIQVWRHQVVNPL